MLSQCSCPIQIITWTYVYDLTVTKLQTQVKYQVSSLSSVELPHEFKLNPQVKSEIQEIQALVKSSSQIPRLELET